MISSALRPRFVSLVLVCLVWALGLSGAESAPTPVDVGSLRLIGLRTIPSHLDFQGTVVGGLSGLDYDAASDSWVAISDDKSEFSPARFYTLKLDYDAAGFTAANVTGVTLLRQADGTTYPDKPHAKAAGGGEVPDFESIRVDPQDGSVWHTSEGDRYLGLNPFLRHDTRDGRFIAEMPQPAMFKVSPQTETGPRQNLSFEGLTFAPDGQSLWLAMEGPRYEDGPVPTPAAGAFSRLTHYARSGKVLGQFAYPVDAIPVASAPGKWNDNGVSEMLAINDHRFLLLERSGAQGAGGNGRFSIRLYAADVAVATDVSGLPALVGATYTPAKKQLVLDFSHAGLPETDNLEGLSWGRRLPNGHATLVVIADDNFAKSEQTQVWVFEVLPPAATKAEDKWDKTFEGVVHDDTRIHGFVEGYRWLSNFHPCRVEWEGRVYGSSEAAYQSAKYPPAERDVFTTLDPDAAKKLSRSKPYDTAAWEARKERSMREIVWAKFSQNPELAAQLVATGRRHLEETNWWGDKVWGVFQGEGQNKLGLLLMETRDRLGAAATLRK
jgi:ribA/ribD-fused uncharacterized protein